MSGPSTSAGNSSWLSSSLAVGTWQPRPIPYCGGLVAPSDPRYAEVLEFLYHEAELLDTGAFEEWLGLVTEDAEYHILMPQNQRRHTEHPAEPIPIFLDNYASLRVRVRRLGTTYAWAEDPALPHPGIT